VARTKAKKDEITLLNLLRHKRGTRNSSKKSRHLRPYVRPGRSERTEMATGAQATERVAKPMGVSLTLVERAARILKEADADLWPKAKKGGGKGAAHVMPSHLVNLLLALMTADPITEAPEIVPRYRALIPGRYRGHDVDVFEHGHVDGMADILNDFCPGSNLGERLEGLVRNLMNGENRSRASKLLRSLTVGRSHQSGGEITASIEVSTGTIEFVVPIGDLFSSMQMQNDTEHSGIPEAAISDTKSVPFRIFEIMADLVLDTERELGQSTSSDAAGDTAAKDVETTTPATVATGPAHVDKASQPGANPVSPADVSNQQDSDEKERGQSPAPSSSYGSPSSKPSARSKDEPPWPRSNSPTHAGA
jgi:hypothetical protein